MINNIFPLLTFIVFCKSLHNVTLHQQQLFAALGLILFSGFFLTADLQFGWKKNKSNYILKSGAAKSWHLIEPKDYDDVSHFYKQRFTEN